MPFVVNSIHEIIYRAKTKGFVESLIVVDMRFRFLALQKDQPDFALPKVVVAKPILSATNIFADDQFL